MCVCVSWMEWKDPWRDFSTSGTFRKEYECGCCVSTNQKRYAILSRLLHTSENVNNLSDKCFHDCLKCLCGCCCCFFFLLLLQFLLWPWKIGVLYNSLSGSGLDLPCCYLFCMCVHLLNHCFHVSIEKKKCLHSTKV